MLFYCTFAVLQAIGKAHHHQPVVSKMFYTVSTQNNVIFMCTVLLLSHSFIPLASKTWGHGCHLLHEWNNRLYTYLNASYKINLTEFFQDLELFLETLNMLTFCVCVVVLTGNPKGAILTHGNIVSNCSAIIKTLNVRFCNTESEMWNSIRVLRLQQQHVYQRRRYVFLHRHLMPSLLLPFLPLLTFLQSASLSSCFSSPSSPFLVFPPSSWHSFMLHGRGCHAIFSAFGPHVLEGGGGTSVNADWFLLLCVCICAFVCLSPCLCTCPR